MTFLEEFQGLSKNWIFWTFVILVFLGFCMIVYLTYKAKDKIVQQVIAIPFSLLTMFVISMAVAPLLVSFSEVAGGLIKGTISAFSFSTVFFIIRKYAVPTIRKAFQWNVQKPK